MQALPCWCGSGYNTSASEKPGPRSLGVRTESRKRKPPNTGNDHNSEQGQDQEANALLSIIKVGWLKKSSFHKHQHPSPGT